MKHVLTVLGLAGALTFAGIGASLAGGHTITPQEKKLIAGAKAEG